MNGQKQNISGQPSAALWKPSGDFAAVESPSEYTGSPCFIGFDWWGPSELILELRIANFIDGAGSVKDEDGNEFQELEPGVLHTSILLDREALTQLRDTIAVALDNRSPAQGAPPAVSSSTDVSPGGSSDGDQT